MTLQAFDLNLIFNLIFPKMCNLIRNRFGRNSPFLFVLGICDIWLTILSETYTIWARDWKLLYHVDHWWYCEIPLHAEIIFFAPWLSLVSLMPLEGTKLCLPSVFNLGYSNLSFKQLFNSSVISSHNAFFYWVGDQNFSFTANMHDGIVW